jgi:hypothetical protein
LIVYIKTTHPDHRNIEDILNERFRIVNLRFVYVKNINKTKSGKSQYFIQMLKNETANTKY